MLFAFKPSARCPGCRSDTPAASGWQIVQIASAEITEYLPPNESGPPHLIVLAPFIDGQTSETDPSFKGQAVPPPPSEEAAGDFPGFFSPWTATNPDGSRRFRRGTRLDAEFKFTTWVVCPHKEPAGQGRAELVGAVKWRFRIVLAVGDSSSDTTQDVEGSATGFAHGARNEDQAALAQYMELLAPYIPYLPRR